MDAESILIRHQGNLDVKYLRKTAQQMADELQDAQIWHRLLQLLQMTSKPKVALRGFLKGMKLGQIREKKDRI